MSMSDSNPDALPPRSSLEQERYYRAQWKAFALRRSSALFFLFSWPFVAIGLFYYSRMKVHQPELCLVVIVLWLALAFALVWWVGEVRCPRCRRRYGALGNRKGDTNYTRGLFDKVCANCKLRKFELG